MEHRRKLPLLQSLSCQDDLPQCRSTDAFAQRWFTCINKDIRKNFFQRRAFCLIDKRSVRARYHKIDFAMAEIA